MASDTLLMVFIKNLEKGKVKTRLAATIGDDKALEVYNRLLDYTHSITKNLPCDKAVYYSNFIEENDQWNAGDFEKNVQSNGNLGERMSDAFQKHINYYTKT